MRSTASAGRRTFSGGIDLLKGVEAGPPVPQERGNSVPAAGLNGQRDSDRLGIVDRAV
jgi:hypothetical protein